MKRLFPTASALIISAFAIGTLPVSTGAFATSPPHPNWTATVIQLPNGSHTLGNPNAKVKVTEYVSYTCPHCAHFNKDSDAALRLAYITPGKASITVQHVIRDPIDLAVAMLTNCGDNKGFFRRHNAFMASQEKWLAKAQSTSEAQQARWNNGKISDRLKAISNDLGFYATMEQWGYTRPTVDQCLTDQAKAKILMDQTQESSKFGVTGTPSFAINGVLLDATHDWTGLEAAIKSRL